MDVEINMLNVEDGDAIIIMLNKNEKKSLILIDGGYKKHYGKIERRLKEVLPFYNNKIDLLICTHYDNDHIGGVEKLLDEFHSIIEEIWIHKIEDNLSELQEKFSEKIELLKTENDSFDDSNISSFFKNFDALSRNIVLEGYRDLLRVVNKIRLYGLENKIVQATKGKFFNKFPEFKVISPTAEYYNSNLPHLKAEAIFEDLKSNRQNSSSGLMSLQEFFFSSLQESGSQLNSCDRLEVSSLANNVSATNMVSIVTLLEANGRKYLFTGDSGIESFTEHISNWEIDLKNLYFLDLAHHGSKNNTSRKQIDIFNPEIVFVSGDNGPNRPSMFIRNCITSRINNKIFEVTNSNDKTWYLKLDKNGNFSRITF